MDVVKTNVEKIGGMVDVTSRAGAGATVRIKLPLTLAIIPALLVTCRGQRFAIPQAGLTELVRLEASEAATGIEMVHGVPVYRLRGRLLPLIYLSEQLQLHLHDAAFGASEEAVNIAVLQADDRQFGLVVDEINDSEEIVVKPLRRQLKAVKAFAGSTIMGDGRVALILDVLGLAQRASVISEAHEHGLSEKSTGVRETAREKRRYLLFEGPRGSRMAMPLDTLTRLEKLPSASVEKAGKQWVAQYRGEILPLLNLGFALEERCSTEKNPGWARKRPLSIAGACVQSQRKKRWFSRGADSRHRRRFSRAEVSRQPSRHSVFDGHRPARDRTDRIPAILQAALSGSADVSSGLAESGFAKSAEAAN